jgi:hypothetical protein
MGGVPGTNKSLLQCLIGFRKRLTDVDPVGEDAPGLGAKLSRGTAILKYNYITQLDPAHLDLGADSRTVFRMQASACGDQLNRTLTELCLQSPLQCQKEEAQLVLPSMPQSLQAWMRPCSGSSYRERHRHQGALVLPSRL